MIEERQTFRRSLPALQFLRFLGVGLLNTAFGYLLFGAGTLSGLPPEIALLVATCLGVAFNYFTTGRLVFASQGMGRMPRFIMIYAMIYVLNVVALRMLITEGVPALYAQVILLPIIVVITFLAMRTFVFVRRAS